MERILGRSGGFLPQFDRGAGTRFNMHYCPGCGHGVLHKLIAEAIEEFGIKDRTILISPVGCAVFAYCYFDCFGISVPHGRAPAVGTGLSRSNPESVVISYQGDGDLGAIGFNELIHAANRGENMTVLFVNNAIYGMTGGQMAPTTLTGSRTMTSPTGRTIAHDGYPLKVAELVAELPAPVYVERVALSTGPRILAARKALRKAIRNTMERKGFSLVEFLSGCPVNMKLDAAGMIDYLETKMAGYFPLGCLKDVSASTPSAAALPAPEYGSAAVMETLIGGNDVLRTRKTNFRNLSAFFDKERRLKIAGAGGQGVLSFGMVLAAMAGLRNFNVTYLPAYGPEMRGGTAGCSVVFSRERIASPVADSNCNLLVALNQPSLERYLPELKPTGILVFDSSVVKPPPLGKRQRGYSVNAAELALELGEPRCANSILLGALGKVMNELFLEGEDRADFQRVVEEAVKLCFAGKPRVAELNLKAYQLGLEHAVSRR